MKSFIKHLVECHCTLSIFKNKTSPIYHKIPVLSFLDEKDQVLEKYISCNNCGIIHRVHEISKSEIKWGQEDVKSLINSIDDIKFNLENQGYEKLVNLLEQSNLEICDWELIEFLLEEEKEGNIILEKNESDNNIVLRILEIKSNGKFKLKKETSQRYL